VLAVPFLDIYDHIEWRVTPNEQGLLGLAFHPDYGQTGRFFVFYTAKESGANVVSQFLVSAADPNAADPGSEEVLLEVSDRFRNHNGGMIDFGPDGYLYVGMGDGGSSNDPDNNGQDLTTLLGAMLRLDVDGGNPYAIPPDNPYVGAGGENPPREEIWLSGLRNPWRWSFDRRTGDLYIADVGQGALEEVNVIPAGQSGLNLGWKLMEGTNCNQADCSAFTPPVHVYGRNLGVSITGGYVYRGTCAPDLDGRYFFGDWASERIWTFVYQGGEATAVQEVTSALDPGGVIDGLSSFGQDATGELYVVSLYGGEVYRIVVQ
jgi:glucose/arabinose dehydrogenase